MSRIGKTPVAIPDGVKITLADHTITVAGPLGQLQWEFRPEVQVTCDEPARQIRVTCHADDRQSRALHGLTRALIQNMVAGVTQGYEKRLEIHGVGYLAALAGNDADKGDADKDKVLQLRVGYANELQVPIPEGIEVAVPDQQHIVIRGIDKQKVGQFAAEVRALRKPEPYKGKGIRYMGEQIRRKQGKAMVK